MGGGDLMASLSVQSWLLVTVVSEPSDREEVKHFKKVLTANGYKKWAFEIPQKREKDRATSRKFHVSTEFSH